jgi:hypothetical protein
LATRQKSVDIRSRNPRPISRVRVISVETLPGRVESPKAALHSCVSGNSACSGLIASHLTRMRTSRAIVSGSRAAPPSTSIEQPSNPRITRTVISARSP